MIWKIFIEKNIEEINSNKERVFDDDVILFNDIVIDMLSNKNLNPIVAELFIRDKKLNISPCFYLTILLICTKNIGLHSIHFYYENFRKTKAEQITCNHSSDIGYEDIVILFLKIHCKTMLFFSD